MSNDIKNAQEEELKWLEDLSKNIGKSIKSGKSIIVDVSASGQIISMTKQSLQGQAKRLPALIDADVNRNGVIEPSEFSAAMGNFYSGLNMIAVSLSLDCKNPSNDKGALVAEDATREANRLLAMLRHKIPGLGAKEYVDWLVTAYDVDKEFRERGTADRVLKALPDVYKQSDVNVLASYENDQSRLGALPTQVLPLKPEDLCRGLEAARK